MLIARITALALVAGSVPAHSQESVLEVPLCTGGAITIPLEGDNEPARTPCPLKACHAGTCRKQFDRSQ